MEKNNYLIIDDKYSYPQRKSRGKLRMVRMEIASVSTPKMMTFD